MLTSDDSLSIRPRRILVADVSGVGKSTFARRLGSALDIPYTEIDALFHGQGWTVREEFRADVDAFTSNDSWITEWQYELARDLLAARAEMMVWLDLPFRVTLTRVVMRTVRRRSRREELWNGNLEPPLHTFFTSKEHVVRWAISTRRTYRDLVSALADSHPHLLVVRLRSAAAADRWLAALSASR